MGAGLKLLDNGRLEGLRQGHTGVAAVRQPGNGSRDACCRAAEAEYETALAKGDAPVLLEAWAGGLHKANIGKLLSVEWISLEIRIAQQLIFEHGRLRLFIVTRIAPRDGHAWRRFDPPLDRLTAWRGGRRSRATKARPSAAILLPCRRKPGLAVVLRPPLQPTPAPQAARRRRVCRHQHQIQRDKR